MSPGTNSFAILSNLLIAFREIDTGAIICSEKASLALALEPSELFEADLQS